MITAGGLVFVAGTLDQRLRAFDIENGRELWSDSLPAAGNAMPMTYQAPSGRQYLVIAAGGRGGQWTLGDHVVAYALSDGGGPPTRQQAFEPWGRFEGEMIVEQRRMHATLELARGVGDSVTGSIRIQAPAIEARVLGVRTGNRFRLSIPFSLVEPRCTGTIDSSPELANRGQLLVGELVISGPCTEAAPDPGTMALRRQK